MTSAELRFDSSHGHHTGFHEIDRAMDFRALRWRFVSAQAEIGKTEIQESKRSFQRRGLIHCRR